MKVLGFPALGVRLCWATHTWTAHGLRPPAGKLHVLSIPGTHSHTRVSTPPKSREHQDRTPRELEGSRENGVTGEGHARGTLGNPSCVVQTGGQRTGLTRQGGRPASEGGSSPPPCVFPNPSPIEGDPADSPLQGPPVPARVGAEPLEPLERGCTEAIRRDYRRPRVRGGGSRRGPCRGHTARHGGHTS